MAEWSEFDLDGAVWKIPAARMKMRRPHEIPLSRQVLAYLAELLPLTGPQGYVFPAFHTSHRPQSENTINQAFRRMGYGPGEITPHGLRTTASTLLNESGKWSPDAIERSLAHQWMTDTRKGVLSTLTLTSGGNASLAHSAITESQAG